MKKNTIRKDLTDSIVFYNSAEVMEILQISRGTFNNYLKAGTLKGTKIGGSWRFAKEDILNLVQGLSNTNNK